MSSKPGRPSKSSKSKKNKGRNSGTRRFVTSAEELAHRDTIEEKKQEARRRRRNEDDSDEDESGSENEEVQFDRMESVREEEEEEVEERVVKPKGVQNLIEIQNPNMIKPQNKVMKAKDMTENFEQKLSRREREAIQKERAAAEYRRRHLAGETEEARKDLERLKMVKKRREDAEKRRKEEEEANKAKKEKQKSSKDDDEDDVLEARTIKQMKPSVLKEKLKERGLSIQGQKKDLIQRLIDYENEKSL